MPQAAGRAPMPAFGPLRVLAFGAVCIAGCQVDRSAAAAEPAALATPVDFGADRAAVDNEIAAAMEMTPPGRSITADLASGARLVYSVSPYKAGANGADCRDFTYEYRAPASGYARVAGSRCWLPDLGWHAARADALVETEGLPAPPAAPSDAPAGPAAEVVAADPGAPAQTATEPDLSVVRMPQPLASAAPPSRIILPFRLDETRPVAQP